MAEDLLIEHGSQEGKDMSLTIVAGFALGGLILAMTEWEVALIDNQVAQLIFFVAGLASCYLTALIWHWKGRSYAGGILAAVVLGVPGIIASLLIPRPRPPKPGESRATRSCPSCKEHMQRDASRCPHCRDASSPWTFLSGRWWRHDDDGNAQWFDERRRAWQAAA